MITSLFKNNVFSYIFIPIIGLTVWLASYYSSLLQAPVALHIGIDSYTFSTKQIYIVTYFITLLFGYILNSHVKKYLFSYEPNNLTFLFYVLFVSLSLSTSFFWELFSVSIVVIILHYIFMFNENKIITNSLFNSSFLVGILIILNLQFVVFIPFILLSYSVIEKLTLKNIILVFVGAFLPFFYIILFSILTDNIDVIPFIFDFQFSIPPLNWKTFGMLFLILIPTLYGFIISLNKRSGTDANSLRMTKITFILLLFTILIATINIFSTSMEEVFILISIPSSILISAFFTNNSTWKKDALFVLLIVLCVLYR